MYPALGPQQLTPTHNFTAAAGGLDGQNAQNEPFAIAEPWEQRSPSIPHAPTLLRWRFPTFIRCYQSDPDNKLCKGSQPCPPATCPHPTLQSTNSFLFLPSLQCFHSAHCCGCTRLQGWERRERLALPFLSQHGFRILPFPHVLSAIFPPLTFCPLWSRSSFIFVTYVVSVPCALNAAAHFLCLEKALYF